LGGVIAAAIFAVASAFGGPESEVPEAPVVPPAAVKLEREGVGRGPEGAAVVWPEGIANPAPAVVFFHGWGIPASKYSGWIDHLARQGNVVIAPRYQESAHSAPEDALAAAVAAIRAAAEEHPVAPASLIVAGHSAGGALAADYAATAAKDSSLPTPVGVYSAYPGRAILGTSGIPKINPQLIPASTQIVALGSPSDVVVGELPAIELVQEAVQVPPSRRRFIEVTEPSAADHYAPLRETKSSRATFWKPLDSLIERSRQAAANEPP
jgi:pimeloyl-ACP methyl ester carboxylesterase